MKTKHLYLICSNDHLQTAFFCGTSKECAEILGLSAKTFASMFCHGAKFWRFFHAERIDADEVD